MVLCDMASTDEFTTDDSASTSQRKGAAPQPSILEKQNEGVLRDVLDELDRERSHRAELAARMKKMAQELKTLQRVNASISGTVATDRTLLSLQAERDGYLELIHGLTQDRPAFSKQQKLPIHVVRLLEVMPWDPRARQYMFGQETVYEWQILGADKNWQTQLRYFPTVFKTLPIVVPQPGKIVGEAPTSSSPPRQCVLTNLEVTNILNIDKGYPLPKDGGDWVWVGGWRIEKNADTDAEGWSYSNDLDLKLESSYYCDFRPPERGTKNLVKRRRKWTRSRAMINYPQASTMTQEYLKLVADKATVDVNVQKLSTQLVETKMKLTTLEADHLALQENTNRRIATLEKELEEKNRILQGLQQQDGFDASTMASLSSKKEQVKELRSVVTAWVTNTVAKRPILGQSEEANVMASFDHGDANNGTAPSTEAAVPTNSKTSNDVKQLMFESLKGKGVDLFEKIKQKSGEEIEKIKKQKVTSSLSPWKNNTTSSTDNDTVSAHVTQLLDDEEITLMDEVG